MRLGLHVSCRQLCKSSCWRANSTRQRDQMQALACRADESEWQLLCHANFRSCYTAVGTYFCPYLMIQRSCIAAAIFRTCFAVAVDFGLKTHDKSGFNFGMKATPIPKANSHLHAMETINLAENCGKESRTTRIV